MTRSSDLRPASEIKFGADVGNAGLGAGFAAAGGAGHAEGADQGPRHLHDHPAGNETD